MNGIEPSVEYLIEQGEVDEDTWYVVVDTYLFATTVTAALENEIKRVYCAKNEEELQQFTGRGDMLIGGERFYEKEEQPVGNSPIVFAENDLPVTQVALTSDNGARKSKMLIEDGARNVILGCFRNGVSVGEILSDVENWKIIPADSDEIPRREDYIAAVLIQNVANGQNPTDEHHQRYLEKIELSLSDELLETERTSYALVPDGSSTVPTWNGEFFERFEDVHGFI